MLGRQRIRILDTFDLDTRKMYEDKHCTCVAKFNIQPWCDKWSRGLHEPFCVLNGGMMSRFCPGSWQLTIDGRPVDAYVTSDPVICKKAESKSYVYYRE